MNMKPLHVAFALVASVGSAFAQLIIPSDGTDGAFSPAANVEIDLSQAITGTWSNPSTSPGNGIYDSEKWAIVFKYSSINIPAGVTVTFKNHPSYAPVVWLVQGDMNIAGTVSLTGKTGVGGTAALNPSEPGPGGFRGAAVGPAGNGAGLGIGGGGGSGAYNTKYGNPQILPLIGGSGGQGSEYSGGGGGGAILIAVSGTIQLTGNVYSYDSWAANSYPGSAGAIKLIANQITGSGNVNAANSGRVRIEANTMSSAISATPATIAVPPGMTPIIFQSASSPVVKIVSVDGLPSPADPTAPLVSSADIAIQKNTPVTVVLKTYNFATAGAVVALRIANKFGGASSINATLQGGGTSAESTWTVSTTLAPGFVTLQARATAP
jgi:hypothetical protein